MIVTAYVALLAAAIGTSSAFLVDVVWVVTLVAICYAIVVAVVERGKRQAMAVGFVALAAVHIVCIYLMPNSLPSVRLLTATGYKTNVNTGTVWYEEALPQPQRVGSMVVRVREVSAIVPELRGMNGVMTLVAGFLGSAIGALAFNHRRVAKTDP